MRYKWSYNEALKEARKNGHVLTELPDKLRTLELSRIALAKNGDALKYLSDNKKTEELCEIAVNNTGLALQYVPEKLKTKKLCKIALNDPQLIIEKIKYQDILKYVPERFKTEELCDKAIDRNGRTLGDIPKRLKTYERCKRALENDGFILDVPEELHTPELYRIICNKFGWQLEYVPFEERSPEICEIAVKGTGRALNDVPEELRTPKICALAYFQPHMCDEEWIPAYLRKGKFKADKNDVYSLKLYIEFTPESKQKEEYIKAFLQIASIEDINDIGNRINTEVIPIEMIALLISTSNERLFKFAMEKLSEN